MKEIYKFSITPSHLAKPALLLLHHLISKSFHHLIIFLFCFLLSATAFGQQFITPGANPTYMIRMQGIDFPVTVTNPESIPVNDLTLEASASAGFSVSPASISNIDLDANGGSVLKMFTVTASCSAPQTNGYITYTLKNSSGVAITSEQSYTITLTEPDFVFTPPTSIEVDYVSATNIYYREWSIKQTTPNVSLNHIRIVNECSKSVLNITMVELFSEVALDWIDVTATVLNATSYAGGYWYNITAPEFTMIGNKNNTLDVTETIRIRETYQVLSCDDDLSTYSYGHGDGTTFCYDTHHFPTNVTVVQPGYVPDIINTRAITFPLNSTGTGKISLTLTNNSVHNKAIFYDVKVTNFIGLSNYDFTRAYLVDKNGNPLDFPDLIMDKSIAVGSLAPSPLRWVVSFANLNVEAKASDYEKAGLHDVTGDKIWNDMIPGDTCYIVVEFKFDHLVGTQCSESMIGSHGRQSHIYYKNSCGEYQGYIREYSTNNLTLIPSTYTWIGELQYQPPRVIMMTPENLHPNDPAELYILEQSKMGSTNEGWLTTQNYDHYIIITLPEGFDYHDDLPGFKINDTLPYCAIGDVIRDEDASGIVTLTVHNKLINAYCQNQYYTINIFAKNTIESDAIKNISISHEWGYKDGTQRRKYGCHEDLPVNYKLITSWQNMTLTKFDALRMTFGWPTNTDLSAAARITTANIGSHPGIRRDVAGPFDNVDIAGEITIQSGFSVHSPDSWLVDLSYNGVAENEYFFFPNPAQAVEVSLNGGTPSYIPESALTTLNIPVSGGVRYTLRADLAPFTLTGGLLDALTDGDVVSVIFKTQTMEQIPNQMRQLQDFTMQTYIDAGSGVPEDKNILTKNFHLVNYAFLSTSSGATGAVMQENTVGNTWMFGYWLITIFPISSSKIFTDEYRPNQFVTRSEFTYNTLVDITEVQTSEYGVKYSKTTSLTPSEYNVTQSGGNTTVTVYKMLHAETIGGTVFHCQIKGKFYCPTNTTISSSYNYKFYPSSENPVDTPASTTIQLFPFGRIYYTYNLSAVEHTVYPATNFAEWDFTLTNQSLWANTDGLLPNSWMAVTLPSEVDPTSISLSNSSATYTYADFYPYGGSGSNKYWVKLGDLNINTYQDYKLSCTYSACEPFDLDIRYGMSRGAYPLDPASGFKGDDPVCGNYNDLTLSAIPKIFSHHGEIVSPDPDGSYQADRYSFCNDHTFKAIFTNTQQGVLQNPVLKLTLQVGMELNHSSVVAMQNGVGISPITITGDDDPDTERIVEISFPAGTVLEPNGIPGYQIEITFGLRAVCGFTSGSALYTQFIAEDACGTPISEFKISDPLFIDGISINSGYTINNLIFTTHSITGDLNLSDAAATAASDITITADIKLATDDQSLDYVYISFPPNMTISYYDAPNPFIFHKVVAGDNVYCAAIPADMNKDESFNIEVLLKPLNPDAWSCDSVDVGVYTGVFVPLTCDANNCYVDEKHHNEIKERFGVVKNDISFASATATGTFESATTEKVSFSGILNVPKSTNLDNVKIEVYSNASGNMLPLSGLFFTIPNITTDGSTTTFPFTATNLIIPATDMCNLWLVIRRSENPYICDSVAIRVLNPDFKLTQENYTVCQGKNLAVGDATAITGYTYVWSPDTYITSGNPGMPVTVNYSAGVSGNQTLSLSLSRSSCNTTTAAIVAVDAIPFCDAPTPAQQICSGSKPADLSLTSYTGNVVRWEYSNNNFASDKHSISNTTTTLTNSEMPALTANTSFRAVVENGICDDVEGDPVLITVTQNSVGGTLSAPQTINSGDIPDDISLFGKTGEVQSWEISTDNFSTVSNVVHLSSTTLPISTMGALTTDHYYRAVVKNGVCDPVYSDTLKVTVNTISKLLDCSHLGDKTVKENGYMLGYTQPLSKAWDMITTFTLDSIKYTINGIKYGNTDPSTATLDGYVYPVGITYIEEIGYLGTLSDTCRFTVTVKRVCPAEVYDFEGNKYKVSDVGELCWIETLRSTVYPDGITPITWAKPYYSIQYPDVAKHDTVFGLLYTWYSAVGNDEGDNLPPLPDINGNLQGICPDGWHIPSVAEWNELDASTPVEELKSTNYWLTPPGPGNNHSGFDARPAGWCSGAMNKFIELYGYAGWWAFNSDPSSFAPIYYIAYYCDFVIPDTKLKSDGLSVRCVMD
jgi:uncharacterized protein (TIGR02145 family)